MRFGAARRSTSSEDDEGVDRNAQGRRPADRNRALPRLAGCDGGGSTVGGRSASARRRAGIVGALHDPFPHRRRAKPRAAALGRDWHYQSVHGTLIAQNDVDTWTLHTRYPANEADATRPEELLARFVGREFPMEMLSPILDAAPGSSPGARHQRVLLAGDAGHQYIPTGGYGMNTGIGDAYGLAGCWPPS